MPRREPAKEERTSREQVQDAVDRLHAVDRVQRRDDQVPGLRGLDRRHRGIAVTDLTDEDHVGILADDVTQRVRVRVGIDADLPLLDDREHVVVHHLDRVLDRDDVRPTMPVDVTDHRRDRGRLAGARRSGDQHQPPRCVGEARHDAREPQLLEGRHLAAHAPDREPYDAALAEHVHPEATHAGQRVSEVGLARLGEFVLLVLRHQRRRSGLCVGAGEHVELARQQFTVDAHERHVADLQVQVARTAFDRVSQQRIDIHRRRQPPFDPRRSRATPFHRRARRRT
jgi:hypothetical protein